MSLTDVSAPGERSIANQPRDLAAEYVLGFALATPFYAYYVPWRFLIIILVFSILLFLLKSRNIFHVQKNYFLAYLIFAIALGHSIFLTTSPSEYFYGNARSIFIGTILVVLFLTASNSLSQSSRVFNAFEAFIIPLAVLTAAFGLLKLGMQDRGFQLAIILKFCPGKYPGGSSLCSDYNMQATIWLVAIVCCISFHARTRNIIPILLIMVLAAALLHVGSRRALLLIPAVLGYWLFVLVISRKANVGIKRDLVLMGAAIVGSAILAFVIPSEEGFLKYQRDRHPFTIVYLFGSQSAGADLLTEAERPMRAYPDVMLGTVLGEKQHGPRLDRYALAWDLIRERPWIGMGYRYQTVFSCKFVGCKFADYPHMPVLSAWLIGGVGLAALTLAAYFSIAYTVVKAGVSGWTMGTSAVVLVSVPSWLISGDTFFSLPHIVAVSLLLLTTTKRGSPEPSVDAASVIGLHPLNSSSTSSSVATTDSLRGTPTKAMKS